jgi:adenylate cyclase
MSLWRRFADALFGPAYPGRPPERVLRAIADQQRQSERLIAMVQFAVILAFTVLYAVAPRPTDQGMIDQMIFKVIIIYGVYSTVRLLLAMRGFTPAWFLGLSGLADVALLMLLIWSIHIDYQQPAGFYLKAPTLLYVFIFIALRALRFDVVYLLLTGLTAAAGWLLLLFLALDFDALEPQVTRSYVEYMTSAKILRGAEFDKVISILMTTAILAVAILRARRLLIRAVVEGEAARDLKRFFAPEIAQAITASASRIQPGEGKMRDAAILHVDIRGFTPLSQQLQPSELMLLLADYQARMVTPIQEHGGSIDKFLGDGILASFGAAKDSNTYAADALRAAHDLRHAADIWAKQRQAVGLAPIRIGVTVAAGPVVFGAVGDATRLEYTVIGDAVNLAAKLDKQCKVENCIALASAEMLYLAEAQGYTRPDHVEIRPQCRVDGVPEPLDLAVLER